jgi:hypothetical protein
VLGSQNSVRDAGSVDLVRRVYAFMFNGSGRVPDERNVVAKLHAEASGAFDAGIRHEANQGGLQ